MSSIDCLIEAPVVQTTRVRQIEAMFDVPPAQKTMRHWKGDVPLDERPWDIGLIAGPSGSGKSTLGRKLFGENYHPIVEWTQASVLDDCAQSLTVEEITQAFGAVGFGTIPAWLRPYKCLSTGERFRAEVARRMLELESPVVIDEFTSVVDRQVAKIASDAVGRYVRKNQKQLVAISCHYDIVDWLQPDWILEPGDMSFQWRSLRQRPALELSLRRVKRSMWELFAPFHYMSAKLHNAAQCFCAFVNGSPACFAATLHFPHPIAKNIRRGSRIVTLPDWQGLGIAAKISDILGSIYKACGYRFRVYPAHPPFIRSYDKSPKWSMEKKPGHVTSPHQRRKGGTLGHWEPQRTCAVFEYRGDPFQDRKLARAFLAEKPA